MNFTLGDGGQVTSYHFEDRVDGPIASASIRIITRFQFPRKKSLHSLMMQGYAYETATGRMVTGVNARLVLEQPTVSGFVYAPAKPTTFSQSASPVEIVENHSQVTLIYNAFEACERYFERGDLTISSQFQHQVFYEVLNAVDPAHTLRCQFQFGFWN